MAMKKPIARCPPESWAQRVDSVQWDRTPLGQTFALIALYLAVPLHPSRDGWCEALALGETFLRITYVLAATTGT